MANDRLFIRCTKCDAPALMVAKYYPGPTLDSYVWKPEQVGPFIEKHLNECRGTTMDLEGDPGFEFLTEDQPDEPRP